ncbi:Retrovirus-related Pol polyprotein from transposon, partial [Trichinella patagoniensis]
LQKMKRRKSIATVGRIGHEDLKLITVVVVLGMRTVVLASCQGSGKRETERKGNAPVSTGPSPNSDGRTYNLVEELNEPARGSGPLQWGPVREMMPSAYQERDLVARFAGGITSKEAYLAIRLYEPATLSEARRLVSKVMRAEEDFHQRRQTRTGNPKSEKTEATQLMEDLIREVASGREPLERETGTILLADGRRMCISGVGVSWPLEGTCASDGGEKSGGSGRPGNELLRLDGSKVRIEHDPSRAGQPSIGCAVVAEPRSVGSDVGAGADGSEDWTRALVDGAKCSARSKRVLRSMLRKCEKAISLGEADLRRTSLVNHRIETGGAQPVKLPPRRREVREGSPAVSGTGVLLQAEEEAFARLKDALVSPPILWHPGFDRTFLVDVIASEDAIGAVLSQQGEQGPPGWSRTPATRSHGRSGDRNRMYDRKFTARTDHNSLKWLWNFREPEGQVFRWLEKLAEFDFEVVHRPGKKHQNADALSRRACRQCGSGDDSSGVHVAAMALDSSSLVERWQKEDAECMQVQEWIEKEIWPQLAREGSLLFDCCNAIRKARNRKEKNAPVSTGPSPNSDGRTNNLEPVATLCAKVDAQLDEAIRKFWEIETIRMMYDSDKADVDSTRAVQKFESTLQFDGIIYTVRLPWLKDDAQLPNNYHQALRRLQQIERSLKNDPRKAAHYERGMKNVVPHHAVIREDNIIINCRIVFDGSAQYGGVALNQNLDVGPALQNDLIKIEMSPDFCGEAAMFKKHLASIALKGCVLDYRVHHFSYIRHSTSSKAKVAPLKQVTLPRLQLMAAFTAAKLIPFVKNNLGISVDELNFLVNVEEDIKLNPESFEDFEKLIRVTAYCRRFLANCRHPESNRRLGPLTLVELQIAENYWIRKAQREYENGLTLLLSSNLLTSRCPPDQIDPQVMHSLFCGHTVT